MRVLVDYNINLLRSSLKAKGLFGTINKVRRRWIYTLKGLPTYIQIEITNRCNLSCPYCAASRDIMKDSYYDMNFKEFKKIIDDLAFKSKYYPSLQLAFRGEPFLNKDASMMIRYATTRNFYVTISTNGLLLNKELNNNLINSRLDYVVISLDGARKETYEKNRVGGKFDTLIENIKDLVRKKKEKKSKKPFIELQFIITKQTEMEIEEFKKLGSMLNVDNLKFKTYKLTCSGRSKDSIKLLKGYLPTDNRYSRYKIEGDAVIPKVSSTTCSWANDCIIYADGDVGACCADYDKIHVVGNVLKKDFWEIWNSIAYVGLRGKIKKQELAICKNCY